MFYQLQPWKPTQTCNFTVKYLSLSSPSLKNRHWYPNNVSTTLPCALPVVNEFAMFTLTQTLCRHVCRHCFYIQTLCKCLNSLDLTFVFSSFHVDSIWSMITIDWNEVRCWERLGWWMHAFCSVWSWKQKRPLSFLEGIVTYFCIIETQDSSVKESRVFVWQLCMLYLYL